MTISEDSECRGWLEDADCFGTCSCELRSRMRLLEQPASVATQRNEKVVSHSGGLYKGHKQEPHTHVLIHTHNQAI